MEKISFVVSSCDKYKNLWPLFFQCFFKYWKDCDFEIILVSNYEVYDDKRVRTLCIGEDQDYSTNMNNALKHIHTKWFILWFEDALLCKKVDAIKLKQILTQAIEKKVGALKLSSDYPLSYEEGLIGEIPKGVKYRTALGMSFYNIETFKRITPKGFSPWELDKRNNDHLEDKFFALTLDSSKNLPIKTFHAVEKGEWIFGTKSFLAKEGLSQYEGLFKVQSIFRYLYSQLYVLRIKLLMFLKIHWRD